MPISQEKFRSRPPHEEGMFFQFSQQMESLGILVAEKLINIDLVDKTLGEFVVGSWKKYQVVFSDMREKLPDPFLGEYFQWLSEQIEKAMKTHPRKPAYEALPNRHLR